MVAMKKIRVIEIKNALWFPQEQGVVIVVWWALKPPAGQSQRSPRSPSKPPENWNIDQCGGDGGGCRAVISVSIVKNKM
ncbi:hypothetical protein E2C01_017055 [Portunus trituberculatus]|uniref:Uncharacterized protein n=1 Tax=Portunus trituberculatus TaxID=210409 RepID=A0A5B7DRX6_PORTR|nr:hypothetical protein [Portunus trituberculatus]